MSGKSVLFINNHTPFLGYRISIISIQYPTIRFDLIDKLKKSIYRFVDYRWHPFNGNVWIKCLWAKCYKIIKHKQSGTGYWPIIAITIWLRHVWGKLQFGLTRVNLYAADGYLGHTLIMQKSWKMIENLANRYSSVSTQKELFNEYQHDRVSVVFKIFCVCLLWTKVASALEGLGAKHTI